MQPIDDVLGGAVELAARRRFLPEATYRLQFHAGFTFQDAAALVPYLDELGITHAYASPYLRAKPGSTHGYDIIDHHSLNPEVGGEQDYGTWIDKLREHGMGHILDTVPNHVGVATNDNPWWNDVLENGPASQDADCFDITWRGSPRPELQDRVLIPTLGSPYAQVLEQGQLRLVLENGAFAIYYYDRRFPVAPCSYGKILGHRLVQLEQTLGPESPVLQEYQSILTAIRNLPGRCEREPARIAERRREKEIIKRRLAPIVAQSPQLRQFIEQNVTQFNGTPGEQGSFDLLDDLLNHQCYRLSYWHVASDEINYRRFFDVNDLAALSMEREEVFQSSHELILRLLGQGKLAGLRIDHPDGLYDPQQYFLRLQEHYLLACAREVVAADRRHAGLDWNTLRSAIREHLFRRDVPGRAGLVDWPLYVVAEKILAMNESLPTDWAVYGTSGYDFLNMLNGLFVNTANEAAFTQLYQECVGNAADYHEVVYRKKLLILQISLASELHMLAYQLDRLAQRARRSRDFTFNGLRHALREVIACFPVYRSYVSDEAIDEVDRAHIETAIQGAIKRNPKVSPSIFEFIRGVLLLHYPERFNEVDRAEQRRFVGKFQQVTAPVTAKGIEDTAFYVYNRLVSLNEVGGDPGRFGVSPDALHGYFRERQRDWPYGLSPLSTHDTKRSEDVRARINVLSEIPDDWRQCVVRWRQLNEPLRRQAGGLVAPDRNDEYLLYQTLVGAWPLEPYSEQAYADFRARIQQYTIKALREAKVHTSWTDPNIDYENAMQAFIADILDEQKSVDFLRDLRAFQKRISHPGLLNSLSQTLLRIAAPGVPDTYQGTEIWDFSLVDPDNRRPVDYARRQQMLHELNAWVESAASDRRGLLRELTGNMQDGRIKLFTTWQAVRCRRDHPGLFTRGRYLPADVTGARRDHAFGFARHHGNGWAVAVVPRFFTRLLSADNGLPLGKDLWRDTMLLLPEVGPKVRLRNVLTGEAIVLTEQQGRPALRMAEVLAHFPVALFVSEP